MNDFITVHTLPIDENGNLVQQGVNQEVFIRENHIDSIYFNKAFGRTVIQTTRSTFIVQEPLQQVKDLVKEAKNKQ